jgi:hypothetical protein
MRSVIRSRCKGIVSPAPPRQRQTAVLHEVSTSTRIGHPELPAWDAFAVTDAAAEGPGVSAGCGVVALTYQDPFDSTIGR